MSQVAHFASLPIKIRKASFNRSKKFQEEAHRWSDSDFVTYKTQSESEEFS